jgi:hypothetical protein
MLQRKWLAVPVLSVALVAVWGGAEVQAAPLFTKLIAPVECTATSGTRSLNVRACAANPGDAGAECPLTVPCPDGSGMQCSQWTYDFVWNNMNPDDAMVSVSTNVALYPPSTVPPNPAVAISVENPANAGDNQTKLGVGIFEQRTVRFDWGHDGRVSPMRATIITSPSVPIPGTVGGTDKYHIFFGTCAIQVPGSPGLPQTTSAGKQTFTTTPTPAFPNGITYCTTTNVATGCLVVVNCDTLVPLTPTPIGDTVKIGTGNNSVVTSSTPGTSCPTFTLDDGLAIGSYYVCSGGKCYKVG